MRQSIAPGRMSMAGTRSTGLSNRFSTQPVDFNRYAVNVPGTAQRQNMAQARFTSRTLTPQQRIDMAKDLAQFFQDNGAVFPYTLKEIREGPSQNSFRLWFEFILKMLSRSYEFPEGKEAFKEEVPAVMHCLNYQPTIKSCTMAGLNTPHQWITFLALLDWLRNLVIINNENALSGNELHDFACKYSLDCYKQQSTGNTDFTNILAGIREVIICSSSYDDLNGEINQAQDTLKDCKSKLESESSAILQVEKQISDYKHEIDALSNTENEMKFSLDGMQSKISDVENEISLMEEKLKALRAENEALSKQVATQKMSAYEAQELLQRRDSLRDEFKEKRGRHDELYATQSEKNKRLVKLATEKTEKYRAFCSEVFPAARLFDAEKKHRNLEIALFGNNGGKDSLRASQLDGEVTEMFRYFMNAIRATIQQRLNSINKERHESMLKKLENENKMHRQQLQQLDQRNKVDFETHKIKLREAQGELKQAESEYETAGKQVEEIVKQNDDVNARVDKQSALMKDVEAKMANIDMEENELLNEFADYMVEASTRFDSYSKLNGDLIKQKEMLLEVSSMITDYTKRLLADVSTLDIKKKPAVKPVLSDLNI